MGGLYQFKEEDAEDFAQSQGIRHYRKGKELMFEHCPYCHAKDKWTFSINLQTGKFHCFRSSCGRNGNMITLAQDFDFSLGQNADEYYRPRRHYKTFKTMGEVKQPEPVIAYMADRGISLETLQRYSVTGKKEDPQIVVFPFLDESGTLQTIKYRNPDPAQGQSKEWFEANCKPILFGMNQCNPQNKTLIVTEGQIDSLSVIESGLENAVSVPGGVNSFTWVPYCWNWMQQWERIIIFGDHEKDKVTLYAEFLQRWKSKVWCVRPEDYLDCKDANDILRKYGPEQVRHCIDNAMQPPIPQVVSLADVEDVDVSKMEKLRTGFWKLDDVLNGGLPFGQLVLITGKAGDGKSTFANQIMVNAIDEGQRCFIYSGELPNYLLKSWMIFQAAGPQHVREVPKKWEGKESKEYEVDGYTRKQISEWFRDKIWIRDNKIALDEDEEQVKLTELVEENITKNGVRVILLDNLMTAMDLDPDVRAQDKYDKQSLFMKRLVRISMQYNVLIILVAHKRKTYGSTEVNESVSGTSDIVNLASVVLSYERGGKDDPEDERWLKVTKNRLFGNLSNGIKMVFEESCKRVYEDGHTGERNKRMNWIEEWVEYDDELPWEADDV